MQMKKLSSAMEDHWNILLTSITSCHFPRHLKWMHLTPWHFIFPNNPANFKLNFAEAFTIGLIPSFLLRRLRPLKCNAVMNFQHLSTPVLLLDWFSIILSLRMNSLSQLIRDKRRGWLLSIRINQLNTSCYWTKWIRFTGGGRRQQEEKKKYLRPHAIWFQVPQDFVISSIRPDLALTFHCLDST